METYRKKLYREYLKTVLAPIDLTLTKLSLHDNHTFDRKSLQTFSTKPEKRSSFTSILARLSKSSLTASEARPLKLPRRYQPIR